MYLIWSNEHNAWWRANRIGYTPQVEFAGRYSLEESIRICNSANINWNPCTKRSPNELPILEEAALGLKYKIEPNED
jgi:hypothetical protein